MVNLNEDYSIINPTNNTPSIPLSHKCLTADNSTSNTKGTISFEPIPKGGYDFGYLDDFILSTITIRPNSNLEPNTKYTITVNNLTNDSSFCRPLEKIVMLDNYSFSFTTVDNVTPSLVGYYTFNDVNATTLNDHADEDNNQSFQDATLISTATLHKGFNQRDNGTIKLDGNFAKINNNFPSVDNFTISVWSMNGSQTYPIIGWDANNSLSIPEFKLHVENNNIKVKLGSNTITCSKIVQRNIWNHIVVSVKNGEQNLYLNGLFCQDGTTSGTFKINSPVVLGDFQNNYNSVGNSYSNGYIDELKIFNNYLKSGEVKTLFINTGRNLEGFYPLGNRIINGDVLDFSGNNFNGKICDSLPSLPCNNITSIANRQNYERKSNHATLFDGEYIEVGYQPELNPTSFTIVGWVKPTNSLKSMEGLISSEFIDTSLNSATGYGMYRWAYRYYEDKNQDLSPDTLINREGNTGVASASGNCEEDHLHLHTLLVEADLAFVTIPYSIVMVTLEDVMIGI